MNRFLLVLALLLGGLTRAQLPPAPYGATPSLRQLRWQETEMYGIIHFGMATYADKEWAFGDEDPSRFTAPLFDARRVLAAVKAGGLNGIVVVAKHHDGFCLWPTSTTPHNISASPWRSGKGDMLREYQQACRQLGLKMGIYCSPWDRNSPIYGQPGYVTGVYRKQLEELYTRYGELFMSWHDGANGGDGYYGGTRETRKINRSEYYDWDTTWGLIRRLQPGAAIFGDAGPDVRWVGNESGVAGEPHWATYTPHAPEAGKKPANGFTRYTEGVNGTRNGEAWMPAECDVPLRPGWFYHATDDGKTKSVEKLLDLYYKSVGRGACLDLGIAPKPDGSLSDEDVLALKTFGDRIRATFLNNLAKNAKVTASNIRGGKRKFGLANLVDQDRYSYWATDDSVTKASLTLEFPGAVEFDVIRIRENIKLGQRVETAELEVSENGNWQKIASVTSIGANRLIRLPKPVTATKVRLRITQSPVCIALSDFGLYKSVN